MKKNTLNIAVLLLFVVSTVQLQAQNIAELYEKLDPSVVVIEVISTETKGDGDPRDKVSMGSMGSGVLVSEDGLILTAAHVVNNADAIRVTFQDGQQLKAKILGVSRIADVATIKCEGLIKNPHVAKMGDSDKTKIGDKVMIIGSPMGLDHSLSVGYISRREKRDDAHAGFTRLEYFQTDAAINTGNSGGPMFNMDGEVVGIVSSIMSRSGGFEGIGFVASINIVKQTLLSKSNIWLGVDVFMLGTPMCIALNVPQEGGVLIQNVAKDSPAYFMGLKGGFIKAVVAEREIVIGGDVILEIDGRKFNNEKNAIAALDYLNAIKPGQKYVFKVLRFGKIIDVTWVAK
ncbi:MAG: trypsin-like peptidase domain-containing protein [Bacteroidales bacterium]|nr:trypsin-like peptidase domain-containing protein [Bacteroidales bacterium]